MENLELNKYWQRLIDNVPEELQQMEIWAFAKNDGKGVAKRPLAVLKNDRNSITEKWADIDLVEYQALPDLIDVWLSNSSIQGQVKGAGIVLNGKQGFCVFDGDRKDRASEEDLEDVDNLTDYIKDRTYTEKSYGGGTHAFIETDRVVDGSKGMIEVFTKNRFIAITGDKIGNGTGIVADDKFVDGLSEIVSKNRPKIDKVINTSSRGNATPMDVKSVLSIINNDTSDDYDRWIKIGMAVHSTLNGNQQGLDAWTQWSGEGVNAGKDTADECYKKWNSFQPQGTNTLHASWGTLLYEARQDTSSVELAKIIEDCVDNDLLQLYIHAKHLLYPENNAKSDKDVDPVGAMLDALPDVSLADYPILNGSKKEVLPEYRNLRFLCEKAGIEIRQNMMTKNVEVIFPGDNKKILPYLGKHSVQMVKQYAAISAMNHRDSMFDDSIHVLAQYNQYHPAERLLRASPWDGKSRMDTVRDSVKVADKFKDIWPAYWKSFCFSVINRVLSYKNPESHRGCLVLAGPQGCGKSTLFREIVNFGDDLQNTFDVMGNPREILNKDTIMAFQSLMLCEIAEFDSIIARSEASDAKQMLTRHEDTYRAPYARQTETHPRTVTIVGTTNALTFLNDGSGSTRFNVVTVKSIDLDVVQSCNILEFWREALHLYENEMRNGVKKPWELPEKYWQVSGDLNAGFQQEEPTIEAWYEYVYRMGWTPENVAKAISEDTVEPVNLQRIYSLIEQKFNAKATYRSDLVRAVNDTLGHERRKHNGMRNSWLIPWVDDEARSFKVSKTTSFGFITGKDGGSNASKIRQYLDKNRDI